MSATEPAESGENRPPPWEGYNDSEACWVHYRNEPTPRRAFIRCGECGHVYTRWSLWRAWHRGYKESLRWSLRHPAPFAIDLQPSRFRQWLHSWLRRPSRIFFCQECIHDF